MLSKSSLEQAQRETRQAWKLVSFNEKRDQVPEKSLMMFICSVLGFHNQFINRILGDENKRNFNVKSSLVEMKKIATEFQFL